MKKTIKSAWPYLLLALTIGLGTAILEGFVSIYMMKIIDTTLDGNMDLFIKQAKIILLLAAILLPANIVLAYTKGLYKVKSLVAAKGMYLDGIFDKNINEFQSDNNAKYVSALTNDMNTIENNYVDGIFEMSLSAIYFMTGIVVIASVSPLALGIGVGISLLSTLIAMVLGKPLQRHQAHRSQLFEGYTSYIKEVLSAFHIIKSNNLGEKMKSDFYKKSKDIQQKGYIIDKIYTYFLSIQNFTMNLSFFGIAGIAVFMAIKGTITAGGVILITNNMEKVLHPLMQFSEWLPKIFSVKSLFSKMDESLKNHDNYIETFDMDFFNDKITFENVSFNYNDNKVLKNVELDLIKGEKYLIVGPSGGGKSTLLKLLRKYFNPTEGKILIDNKNLKDIRKESYFRNISNVEQQVFLFEDTLRNNITLYKDYSEEEINLAIERAGLRDFVDGLQNGLDTIIYDNGKNISGGERSRVAIARGLLSKSDIIFLDEAFASLDSKVAKEIENTLLDLDGVTVVNVSHVIFGETKDKYDKVFVVKNKAIV